MLLFKVRTSEASSLPLHFEMNFHEHDILQDDTTDQLLLQATKLNGDLGRFVRTCSFSSQLTGRFYQNNSLETHTAREQRIARMKAKRKKLESDVKVEDAKIKYLEKLLQLKEEKQRASTSFHVKANAAARTIQSFTRFSLAKNKLELLRVERNITIYVALFLQSLFRGMKDRIKVDCIKSENRKNALESAAVIRIQQQTRCFIARSRLSTARKEKEDLVKLAAAKIQTVARSRLCRLAFNRENQRRLQCLAAIKIQTCSRCFHARKIASALRQERCKKKPEKVSSLYDRRYSTYSVKTVISRKPRRQSDGGVPAKDEGNRISNISPLPQANKNRTLEMETRVFKGSRQNPEEGNKHKNKDLYDQMVAVAQQKASERVAVLGRRAKKEKDKKQREVKKIHEKLQQLEHNRKGFVSTSVSATKHDITCDSTVSINLKASVGRNAVATGNDEEFDSLIPENENDIG